MGECLGVSVGVGGCKRACMCAGQQGYAVACSGACAHVRTRVCLCFGLQVRRPAKGKALKPLAFAPRKPTTTNPAARTAAAAGLTHSEFAYGLQLLSGGCKQARPRAQGEVCAGFTRAAGVHVCACGNVG